MNANQFGQYVSDATKQYGLAIKGRYLSLIAAGVKPGPSDVSTFLHFARNLASHVSESVQAAAKNLDSQLAVARQFALVAAINSMMAEFLSDYSIKLRMSALGQSDLWKNQHDEFGLLAQRKVVDEMPKVRDSAGRKWEIEKLAFVLARDSAYQSQVDEVFQTAQKLSGALVAFDSTNDMGETVEVTVSPFDASARDLFHVNSNKQARVKIAQA